MTVRQLKDAGAGVKMYLREDSDGRVHIDRKSDVTAQIEKNKSEFNDPCAGWLHGKNFRKVAHIPNGVIEKWLNEEGINLFNPDHQKAVLKKLNDPEFRFLRNAPGRL